MCYVASTATQAEAGWLQYTAEFLTCHSNPPDSLADTQGLPRFQFALVSVWSVRCVSAEQLCQDGAFVQTDVQSSLQDFSQGYGEGLEFVCALFSRFLPYDSLALFIYTAFLTDRPMENYRGDFAVT